MFRLNKKKANDIFWEIEDPTEEEIDRKTKMIESMGYTLVQSVVNHYGKKRYARLEFEKVISNET